jgi:hypothetical protein
MGKIPVRYLVGGGAGLAVVVVGSGLFLYFGLPAPEPVPAGLSSADSTQAVSKTPIPAELPTGGYVGSAACKSCHPNEHGSWHQSYHRTMTQVASEESVLGDFDDVHVSGKTVQGHFFKEDGQFKVELSHSREPMKRVFTVVMTTGSHVRQAYWLSDPNDEELSLLPFMYLKGEQRWIPRQSAYIRKDSMADNAEMTAFMSDKGRWPLVCIRCHTTHGQSSPVDERGHHFGSPRVAEFGISCEACHGPGATHVQARHSRGEDKRPVTDIVNPAKLPHDRSAQVCGQCHSVFYPRSYDQSEWMKDGSPFRPGDDLFADPTRHIVRGRFDTTSGGSFWPDGMCRTTGREFSGLMESPCYQRGKMACVSCHEMHQHSGDTRTPTEWAAGQLKPGMDGNRACVQCHSRFADAAETARHTHHQEGSSGSKCYNCHMPHSSFGLLKAARSHMISSPTVLESSQIGRPNACNLCHQDQTLAWTAEKLSLWYKQPIPKLSEDEQKVAASAIWVLRGNAVQRALTAWSYGWPDAQTASGNHWQAPLLGQLLDDPVDPVRIIAHRSLKRLPGFGEFDYDFLWPPAKRSTAVLDVRNIWQQNQHGQEHSFSRQSLIDPTGRIQDADFQRLLKLRDNTTVEIAE